MIEDESEDDEIQDEYEPSEEELEKLYEEQAERYWKDKW